MSYKKLLLLLSPVAIVFVLGFTISLVDFVQNGSQDSSIQLAHYFVIAPLIISVIIGKLIYKNLIEKSV